jgi:hypothetical protein
VNFRGSAPSCGPRRHSDDEPVDREFDAQVARTAARPVASGAVSVADAWVFAVVQAGVSLVLFWWAAAGRRSSSPLPC